MANATAIAHSRGAQSPELVSRDLVTGSTERDTSTQTREFARQAVSGGIWAAMSSYLGFLINLLGVSILARFVSPREFGTYALAQTYNQLLFVLCALAPNQVVVQSGNRWPAMADTALRMSVVLRLGLTVVALPIGYGLTQFYGGAIGTTFVELALLQVVDGIRISMGAVLERDLRYKSVAGVSLVAAVFGVLASVALAYWGAGVHGLLAREAVPVLIILASYLVLARRWQLPTGTAWNSESAARVWAFGKGLLSIRVLDLVCARLDRVVLGNLLSLDALGFYTQARYLASLSSRVVAPGNQQVAVVAYSRFLPDVSRVAGTFNCVQFFVVRIVMPLGILCLVWPNEILSVLYGANWLPSASALRVLSICVVIFPALDSYCTLATAAEQWKLLRSTALLQSAVSVAGMLLLAGRLQTVGACIATGISGAAAILYMKVTIRRHFGAGFGGVTESVTAAAIISATFGIAASGVITAGPIVRLAIATVTVLLAYIGALLVLERRVLVSRLISFMELIAAR